MDNAYITLGNLDRFRKNLRRSTAGQGTGARVLHNRMISYYSQPGEVYSVVKRMRIPRVKAGDSFCLKGIVEDGDFIMKHTKITVGNKLMDIDAFGNGYINYDPQTYTLTVNDSIQELIDSFLEEVGDSSAVDTVTLMIPTRLYGETHGQGIAYKMYGTLTKERVLRSTTDYCEREISEIGIDGMKHSYYLFGRKLGICDLDTLKNKGVEVEVLKLARHRPISPRVRISSQGSYHDNNRAKIIKEIIEDAGKPLLEIDRRSYKGRHQEYVSHLIRFYKGRSSRWRWLKCTKWPRIGSQHSYAYEYVRLRTRRGKAVTPWRVYRLLSSGEAVACKEPAKARLDR